MPSLHSWAGVGFREIQNKCAAFARRTLQLNFTAKEAAEFAGNGKSEPGTAILAAGAGVGLLKRFEDDALLFSRDADTGVRNFESDHTVRGTENWMSFAPTILGEG